MAKNGETLRRWHNRGMLAFENKGRRLLCTAVSLRQPLLVRADCAGGSAQEALGVLLIFLELEFKSIVRWYRKHTVVLLISSVTRMKPGQYHDYCFRPRQLRTPAALAYRGRSVAPRTVNNTPPTAQASELSRKSRTFAPRSDCSRIALAQCRKKTGPRMVAFKL
jgi:hypothetical protein